MTKKPKNMHGSAYRPANYAFAKYTLSAYVRNYAPVCVDHPRIELHKEKSGSIGTQSQYQTKCISCGEKAEPTLGPLCSVKCMNDLIDRMFAALGVV